MDDRNEKEEQRSNLKSMMRRTYTWAVSEGKNQYTIRVTLSEVVSIKLNTSSSS